MGIVFLEVHPGNVTLRTYRDNQNLANYYQPCIEDPENECIGDYSFYLFRNHFGMTVLLLSLPPQLFLDNSLEIHLLSKHQDQAHYSYSFIPLTSFIDFWNTPFICHTHYN